MCRTTANGPDVKALYDYTAQTSSEFDFQAGDIIAVTATPADGWWSGEHFDEGRRIPGRTDFPSNLWVSMVGDGTHR